MLEPVLILLTVVFLGVSQIAPLFPDEQYLEHTPTVLAVIVLAIAAHKKWLTVTAFCGVFLDAHFGGPLCLFVRAL